MKKYYKTSIFFFSLIPFFLIIYKTIFNKLGPEPVKEITHLTGEWTLLFIIFTLSMTPLKKITKLNIWISFRRMLGLFIFFFWVGYFATGYSDFLFLTEVFKSSGLLFHDAITYCSLL